MEGRTEVLKRYNTKQSTKDRVAKWKEEHSAQYKASKRAWYLRNKEKNDLAAKEYAKSNPAWKAAHCAKRRSIKLNATTGWADRFRW